MYRIKFIAIVAAIALTTLACNFSINRQIRGVSVGSLETYEIEVPPPDSNEVSEVRLEFGAGELNLSPGSDEYLVSGTATYNVDEFEPRVTVSGTDVEISQQIEEINIIPLIGDEFENVWDLELGSFPMELDISAGGYQGEFELGGVPLHELRIAEGVADTRVSFSELNPIEMDTLRYDTGASKATLTGLANANFDEMDFRSGAGDYRLDFSGQLQRDAEVSIKSGLSSIVIIVPEGTPATVSFEGGLTNVDLDGDWRMSGSNYVLSGEGPQLTISVEMGAGNLELRTR
jgi:hypothetical protein